MVVACKLLGSVLAVGFALSACGGDCIRNSDCPHAQRCIAAVCQGPNAGSGGASGSSAGSSGSATTAGTGGQSGMVAVDAGPTGP